MTKVDWALLAVMGFLMFHMPALFQMDEDASQYESVMKPFRGK